MSEAPRPPPQRSNLIYDFVAVFLVLGIGLFVVYYVVSPRVSAGTIWSLRFVYLVVIVIGAILTINAFGRLIKNYLLPRASPGVGSSLRLAFNVLAYVALLIVVFAYLGVDITGVLLEAGFFGIVLGLAAQTVLGNLLGALAILFARPFVVGDRISLVASQYGVVWPSYAHEMMPQAYTGRVTEINLMYTHFESDDGTPFVVANGIIVSSLIRNHSRAASRELRVRVPVPRTVAFEEYRDRAVAAVGEADHVQKASVRITLAGVDAKTYDVVARATAVGGMDEEVRSEMMRRLLLVTPPVA